MGVKQKSEKAPLPPLPTIRQTLYGIMQPLCQVPPRDHPSLSSSSAGDWRGRSGVGVVVVAGHGGSGGRGSGGGDNRVMFCVVSCEAGENYCVSVEIWCEWIFLLTIC